jgi:hypothetical protein
MEWTLSERSQVLVWGGREGINFGGGEERTLSERYQVRIKCNSGEGGSLLLGRDGVRVLGEVWSSIPARDAVDAFGFFPRLSCFPCSTNSHRSRMQTLRYTLR